MSLRFKQLSFLFLLTILISSCTNLQSSSSQQTQVSNTLAITPTPIQTITPTPTLVTTPNLTPNIPFELKLTSLSCNWFVKTGDYNVKSDCIRVVANGTMSGPVGARLELPILVWSTDKYDCGSWTHKTGALIAVGHTCVRENGQPESSSWKVDTEGDECPLKNYFDNDRSYSVKIYKGNDLSPQKEDKRTIKCQ